MKRKHIILILATATLLAISYISTKLRMLQTPVANRGQYSNQEITTGKSTDGMLGTTLVPMITNSTKNERINYHESEHTEERLELNENVLRSEDGGISLAWDQHGNIETFYGWYPQELQNELLSRYKNPCYMIDGKLYCLPYFFLAGMPKCGTTDIWSKISQHPQVAAAQKEPHWWTRGMIKGSLKLRGYMYQRTINIRKELVRARYDKKATKMIVGDGSASTFWENLLWNKLPSMDKTPSTMKIIASILPNAKFIVSLREPSNRMYSEYLAFQPTSKKSVTEYEQMVHEGISLLRECFNRSTQRECIFERQKRPKDYPFTFAWKIGKHLVNKFYRKYTNFWNWILFQSLRYSRYVDSSVAIPTNIATE
ncbi:uncharacterized protein [Apostichopus japonicus]|uniref:uncharacterized protein isoform X2 n=1 Tax=Stichopus japonicus TaxID=307972 RepID=UPI003AB77A3F